MLCCWLLQNGRKKIKNYGRSKYYTMVNSIINYCKFCIYERQINTVYLRCFKKKQHTKKKP